MNLKISNSTKVYKIDYLEEDIIDNQQAAGIVNDYDDLAHFEVLPHRPMVLPLTNTLSELSV